MFGSDYHYKEGVYRVGTTSLYWSPCEATQNDVMYACELNVSELPEVLKLDPDVILWRAYEVSL